MRAVVFFCLLGFVVCFCLFVGFFFHLIGHFPRVSFFVCITIRAVESARTITVDSSRVWVMLYHQVGDN